MTKLIDVLLEVVPNIEFTKPNFEFEWEEAARYPKIFPSKDYWFKVAEQGKVVNATCEMDIRNTDFCYSDSDELDPNKVARVKKIVAGKKIELPIVMKKDGAYELIGGNTRLTALEMGGIDEKALIAFRNESLNAAEEVYAKLKAQGGDVRELQEFGIALELALAEQIEGLYGEGMTKIPRKITQVYFKAIMLDAWTRTSQVAAYITGKRYITNIGKQLSTGKFDKLGAKIVPKKNAIARLEEEARRLGLNPDELVTWYNNGADINDPFFRNVKRGAVRYQGEIIMNPATVASQKPLVYGGKGTKLIFQLGSFPVAFSNTALKNMARQWIRYPVQNGAPVMGTAATLLVFGDLINMIKSGGTHKDLPLEERLVKI